MTKSIRPRFLFASVAVLFAGVMICDAKPAAANGFGFGFQPFGFYQPYGARFGTALRTPPYFATNPPVYYGARHARPYGISPFAAPPLATAGPGYQSRLASGFVSPQHASPVLSNPCIHTRRESPGIIESPSDHVTTTVGKIRMNPFVDNVNRIAKN